MKKYWTALFLAASSTASVAQLVSQDIGLFSIDNLHVGQSFTAPSTTAITRIGIAPGIAYTGTLYIYQGGNGSGGGGAGTPAYTVPGVTLAPTTRTGPLSEVVLPVPFPVTAGQQYSFVFSGSAKLAFGDPDPYSGGIMLLSYGISYAPGDLRFQLWTAPNRPQTISFGPAPSAPFTVGGTFSVVATATSALPAALSIDPAATGVCSLAGNTVTALSVGTCVVNADQAGDATYLPAARMQQSFAVAAALAPATPTSIPTLSEWGLIFMSALLAMLGLRRVERNGRCISDSGRKSSARR